MIDFIQLQQFLTVARRKNFTKAAKDLFTNRSTLSRNIAHLEEMLGVQLLVRDYHSVTLTPAGEHLARHGQELIWSVENLEAELHRFASNANPQLRIVAATFYSHAFFSAYEQYRAAHPYVESVIDFAPVNQVTDWIDQGDADIGITYSFATEISPKYNTIPIATGEFVFLVANSHPLASESAIDITDPRLECPLMLDQMDYKSVMELGKTAVFQPDRGGSRRVKSCDSLILQVKANMGIALLPEHVATQVGYGCSILSIDGVDSTYQLNLFYLKNSTSPVVEEFLHTFSSEAYQRSLQQTH
jgi:DNA-binding transcriptional LysR family regulator